MADEGEIIASFKKHLLEYAHSLAAELKDIDPSAQERAITYTALLKQGLPCPECWVRNGYETPMHQKRWLVTCGEHDYNVL